MSYRCQFALLSGRGIFIKMRGFAQILGLMSLVSGLILASAGCDSGPTLEEREGRRVLDLLNAVRRSSQQSEAFRTAVSRLAEVELEDERVRRTRDTCVAGYEALLGAQAEATRARQLFERFGSGAEQTRDALERGNQMATEAERQVTRCGVQSVSLGARIGYRAPEVTP